MQDFLIRLLITIGIIWLAQVLLSVFNLGEPATKIIFIIVVLVAIIWLLFGYSSLFIY